ncbi:hypothetical protein QBC46DRAFT_379772 [Diplogelasinospora grovesii]|uniref:FAD-binding domain-containing protein n=1 Tax=Diplogelasinospora grovesii TaxID=303347 RepID=A0AAN6NB45_9PEZI|nr:hypothetical protein QBC46DRAFT_379772 [Diplogelasinospora grovesii]
MSSSLEPLRVLIVGAGIAGPALALWLSRLGCQITIIERSAGLRASGQQIDLRREGVPVMKRMGLEPAVRAALVKEPGVRLVDKHGRGVAYFPALKTGTGQQSLTSEFEIMRGDLVRILYDATRDLPGVEYVFNTAVQTLHQSESGDGSVEVGFGDGRSGTYDVVVGADGTFSTVRELMYPGQDFKHVDGQQIAFYSIPSQPGDPVDATGTVAAGGRIMFTRKDHPDYLRVYLMADENVEVLKEARETKDVQKQKQAWAGYFRDAGWQAQRFVDGLLHAKEADDLYTQQLYQVRLSQGMWSKGHTTLVGDAGYSPSNGLGTTFALVGAYVLAGELGRNCKKGDTWDIHGVQAALRAYEEKLRGLTDPVLTDNPFGEWAEKWLLPQTEWGIWIAHLLLRIMMLLRIPDMIIWFMSGRNEKKGWKVPEYPELENKE